MDPVVGPPTGALTPTRDPLSRVPLEPWLAFAASGSAALPRKAPMPFDDLLPPGIPSVGRAAAAAAGRGPAATLGDPRCTRQASRWLLQLERVSPDTAAHGVRVGALAVELGRTLGLRGASLQPLLLSGWLHDLGKLRVPRAVLDKPAALSAAELQLVRRHPGWSAALLTRDPLLAPLAKAVRHHHERWDGAGYPDGVAGAAIPLASRLVAMADAFDALTQARPYRAGRAPSVALRLLQRDAPGQFWPPALEALEAVFVRARRRGAARRYVDALLLDAPAPPATQREGDNAR